MLAENDIYIPLLRRLVPMVIALIVVAGTIEMIRRRRLREEYAVLWLVASVALLVLAIWPELVLRMQQLLNVNYLTIVVLSCFLFLALIVMHFATVITRQADQIRHLAERLALMHRRLDELAGTDLPDETDAQHGADAGEAPGPDADEPAACGEDDAGQG